MTNKTTMPEPVAYATFAENGNIRIWSKEPQDLPDLDSLGQMRRLITTEQAEAYADDRVREALEEAAMTCTNSLMMNTDSYCGATASYCAERIRALIPKEPPFLNSPNL